jgi:hypothetical protein
VAYRQQTSRHSPAQLTTLDGARRVTSPRVAHFSGRLARWSAAPIKIFPNTRIRRAALARLVVAAAVEHHLVGVGVGVVVGHRERQGVVIDLPGTKLQIAKLSPSSTGCTDGGWCTGL